MDPRLCFFYEQCMFIIKNGGDTENEINRRDVILKLLDKCKNSDLDNVATPPYYSKNGDCICYSDKCNGHNNFYYNRIIITTIKEEYNNQNWNDIINIQNAIRGTKISEPQGSSCIKLILIDYYIKESYNAPYLIELKQNIKCRTTSNHMCDCTALKCNKNFLPSGENGQLLLNTKCGKTNEVQKEEDFRKTITEDSGLTARNRNNDIVKENIMKRNTYIRFNPNNP